MHFLQIGLANAVTASLQYLPFLSAVPGHGLYLQTLTFVRSCRVTQTHMMWGKPWPVCHSGDIEHKCALKSTVTMTFALPEGLALTLISFAWVIVKTQYLPWDTAKHYACILFLDNIFFAKFILIAFYGIDNLFTVETTGKGEHHCPWPYNVWLVIVQYAIMAGKLRVHYLSESPHLVGWALVDNLEYVNSSSNYLIFPQHG